MDDATGKLANEISAAIAATVADDPRVEAVREKARALGYELVVTLEAVVGFAERIKRKRPGSTALVTRDPRPWNPNLADKQFLHNLRIAPGEELVEKRPKRR